MRTVVGSFLVLLIANAEAATATQVYDIGTASRGAFVEARIGRLHNPPAHVYITWLTGYLAAIAQQLPTHDNKISTNDVSGWTLWIDKYCRENPISSFYTAAYALVSFLISK
jgi:hypothetical protein